MEKNDFTRSDVTLTDQRRALALGTLLLGYLTNQADEAAPSLLAALMYVLREMRISPAERNEYLTILAETGRKVYERATKRAPEGHHFIEHWAATLVEESKR
jgi:hypothetical protein